MCTYVQKLLAKNYMYFSCDYSEMAVAVLYNIVSPLFGGRCPSLFHAMNCYCLYSNHTSKLNITHSSSLLLPSFGGRVWCRCSVGIHSKMG